MSQALAESGTGGPVELDGGERLQILDALITSIAGAYAHLPAKRAAYASDPVQALTLLRRRAADLSDAEFHRAVTAIVTGLRDAHTRYIGPSTLRDRVAMLPFLVEQYGPDQARSISSARSTPMPWTTPRPPSPESSWKPWNGVRRSPALSRSTPTSRPVAGLTPAAPAPWSRSRFRALDYGPPPDEHWVIVGYRTARAAVARSGCPGGCCDRARPPPPGPESGSRRRAEAGRRSRRRGRTPGQEADVRHQSCGPATRTGRTASDGSRTHRPKLGGWLDTPMQDVLAARPSAGRSATCGSGRSTSTTTTPSSPS